MSDFDLEKIVNIYRSSISHNLENIENEFQENPNFFGKDLLNQYNDILSKTSQVVSERWIKKEKYLRTKYAYNVYKDEYPQDLLVLSLCIDAMINILDDFYDENLSKEKKQIYLIELLRVNSFINQHMPSLDLLNELGFYFDKLITLAVAENFSLAEMKRNDNEDFIKNTATSILLTRASDVDIFVQLAEYKNNITSLVKDFRLFRALNILKKDILDLENDIASGQESVVTFLHQSSIDANQVLISVSKSLIALDTKGSTSASRRLSDMINSEVNEILLLARNL